MSTKCIPWVVAIDHPAFDGHFPGQPILPGVVLLSAALEAAAAHGGAAWLGGPVQLSSAKFLAPLPPGAHCEIHLNDSDAAAPAPRRLRFEIRHGEVIAASGVLERVQA